MIEQFKKTFTESYEKALDTFFEPIKNRFANPIVSSFAISWIVVNWKPVLFLIFSNNSILEKFDFIERTYYGNKGDNINYFLWIPLFMGIIYTIAMPFIEIGLDWIFSIPRKKRIKRNYDLQKTDLFEEKSVAMLKAEIKEISELNSIIIVQKKENKELRDSIEEEKDTTKKVRKLLQDEEQKTTDALAKFSASDTEKTRLSDELSGERQKHENSLNQLNSTEEQIKVLNKELKGLRENLLGESTKNNEMAKSVEELKLENSRLQVLESQFHQVNVELNLFREKNLTLEDSNQDLNTTIDHLENKLRKIESEFENINTSYNELENEKSALEHDLMISESAVENFKNQLREFDLLVNNKSIITSELSNIQNNISGIEPYFITEMSTNEDFIKALINIIKNLSDHIQNPIGNVPNFKVILHVGKEYVLEKILDKIFIESRRWNVRVLNIDNYSNYLELEVYNPHEQAVLDFVSSGLNYWSSLDSQVSKI